MALAERIGLVPDLFGLWLTGELANEVTAASTTGLLDARSGGWAREIVAAARLPARSLCRRAGASRARCSARSCALHSDAVAGARGVPVWTVAAHDTASAFVAAPLRGPRAAVLSSGTWSLLGMEVDEPRFSAPTQPR